ncbi:MAG: SDR family oxidoreductase [Kiritimatiellales bacterium]|nr:SDR family oxidoreductase [Kiritimatiellales bacterium]
MSPDNIDLLCKDLSTSPRADVGIVLVAGATGYIGGRLVSELLARGYRVRVMVRAASPEHRDRWPEAEVVVADALDADSLGAALEGVHTAYYLIHSLLYGLDKFENVDIRAATNFRKAAEEKKVQRIIYLGGLGDTRTELSSHLGSRIRVAQELMAGAVPATILRAAIIIGSGSASYEMIYHLVRKLPVFLIPRWARTKCQPISVRDVIKYLVGTLELPETAGKTFDIGGPDILTYADILKVFSKVLGKRKLFLPSPIESVRFYSYLTGLLTPVPAPINWCLMEGVKNDVICQHAEIREYLAFPLVSCEVALLRAISREEQDKVHTRWSDSYPLDCELAIKLRELSEELDFTCSYSILSNKDAAALFRSVGRIGGKEGWFNSNFLWRLRGLLDRLLLGVGTSRGRRSASTLRVNDVLDFWRVEEIEYNRKLLLRAEMKLPGRAWLEFRIDPEQERKTRLTVNAYYQARGLWGRIYWYILVPFHHFIFDDLIKQIEKRS